MTKDNTLKAPWIIKHNAGCFVCVIIHNTAFPYYKTKETGARLITLRTKLFEISPVSFYLIAQEVRWVLNTENY